MYCEKCGKANPENATKCKYCGTVMPQKTSCGGFGDILSYENSEQGMKEGVTTMNTMPVKTPEKENGLAPILSIIAIGVSAVAIILSIVAMVMCASVDTICDEDTSEANEEQSSEDSKEDTGLADDKSFHENLTKEQKKAYDYFLNNPPEGVNSEEDKVVYATESVKNESAMKEYALENEVTKKIEKADSPSEKDALADEWAKEHVKKD